MSGSMYLVMRLNIWKDFKLEHSGKYHESFPVELEEPTDGSIGFVEVYDTRENALKAHPGSVVLPVELSSYAGYTSGERLPDITYKIADKLPEKLEYPVTKKRRKHV